MFPLVVVVGNQHIVCSRPDVADSHRHQEASRLLRIGEKNFSGRCVRGVRILLLYRPQCTFCYRQPSISCGISYLSTLSRALLVAPHFKNPAHRSPSSRFGAGYPPPTPSPNPVQAPRISTATHRTQHVFSFTSTIPVRTMGRPQRAESPGPPTVPACPTRFRHHSLPPCVEYVGGRMEQASAQYPGAVARFLPRAP